MQNGKQDYIIDSSIAEQDELQSPPELDYLENDYIPHLEMLIEQAKTRLSELKGITGHQPQAG